MATQNVFEKFGIKEVADVTFYRIEKKEETYESIRTISAGSILKGALELRDVYPLDENGAGLEDGFKAYVFTDAQIVTGTNYDCDDDSGNTEKEGVNFSVQFTVAVDEDATDAAAALEVIKTSLDSNIEAIIKTAIAGTTTYSTDGLEITEIGNFSAIDKDGAALKTEELAKISKITGTAAYTAGALDEDNNTLIVTAKIANATIIEKSDDASTGVYDNTDSGDPDASYTDKPGTHEYSYAEQICMLFARRQNLIAKTGVRYTFKNYSSIFGNIDFSTDFTSAPHSTEKIVVVGLAGKFDENAYDLDEINESISQLTDSISTKAYDVEYNDYAELVVNNEMGYYNPAFLGKNYVRNKNGSAAITFFTAENGNTYLDYAGTKPDFAIARAKMWGDGIHYSINDAIDALRQKKLALDAGDSDGQKGVGTVFGGYKVSAYKENKVDPVPGTEDTTNADNLYTFKVKDENGNLITIPSEYSLGDIISKYKLENVLEAISNIGATDMGFKKNVRVETNGRPSNRAIYIEANNAVDTAAGAYIYLLKNQNSKKLSLDKDGIFKFTDKSGNILYYQDKIFAGIEALALVVLGDMGLIFVVNRYGSKGVSRIGWMVGENGYITDAQATTVVGNGLIHTTDITVNNETFEATCTVGKLKSHKTKKVTNRYTPVLFLDTLKVSTLEQTAENTYATGGRGNANLIGWDFGKEITLSLQDALFTPASMSAIFGSYEGSDFRKGVKETKTIDRMEKITAKRNFIIPAGNQNGTPSEADKTAQAVYYDPKTMEPFADGTPIAEGEIILKYTRSVAYEGSSIGYTIDISADKFPGTYKVVGETYVKNKDTDQDQRFQFIIPQAKMTSEQTITLEADGDPAVFDMNMTVLRPDDGVMVRLVQFDVVENEEENDGSTMVKNTENLNLLDDAELYKISTPDTDTEAFIGATEY